MLTKTPRIHLHKKCNMVKHVENQTKQPDQLRRGKEKRNGLRFLHPKPQEPLLKGLESSLACLRQRLWQTERGRKVNRKQNGVLSSCPDSCTQMRRRRALASGQAQKARRSSTRRSFNEKVVAECSASDFAGNHVPHLHFDLYEMHIDEAHLHMFL